MQAMKLTVFAVPLVMCVVLVTLQRADGATDFDSSQGASVRRLLGFGSPKKSCLWQMDECNPYEDVCCKGMKCANAIGSYCRVRVEKCYCVPNSYGKALPYNWN